MQGRIEGEAVLYTDRELAAGQLMAQIEDCLHLGRVAHSSPILA